jgi:hypothetical protein
MMNQRHRKLMRKTILTAVAVGVAVASVGSPGSAAKKSAKKTTRRSSNEVVVDSGVEKRTTAKINGVTYSVTLTEAALIKAMPAGASRRDLGSYTSPEGDVFSLYLRQEGDTVPMPCAEGPNGLNCSVPPKNRISTGGWGGTNGVITIMFAAPLNGEVIVHTVEGDVAPVELGRLPEIGIAWYVHIGAEMSPFGIESKAPGATSFLPSFSPDKATKTDPKVIYSEETADPWSIVEATYGPQRILCLDTGNETTYDSCSPELRPGDKRFGRLFFQRDFGTPDAGFVVACKGAVQGYSWLPVGGAKQPLSFFSLEHPRYSFVRVPGKDGTLTFQFSKASQADLPLGSLASTGFDVLNDLTKVSTKLPACR